MLYRIINLVIVVVVLGGCSLSQRTPLPSPNPLISSKSDHLKPASILPPPKSDDNDSSNNKAKLKNDDLQKGSDEVLQDTFDAEVAQGIVFGKTNFKGVLNTSYVRLVFENLDEKETLFQVHIGDGAASTIFPWDVKPMKPGYFFLSLPPGNYRISQIKIPVGSTVAVEPMDVTFSVGENETVYLGTLQVNGTKEKIRLGGLPVIKPGFEYHVKILDQSQEAIKTFKTRYPHHQEDILNHLMKVNLPTNIKE